MPTLKKGFLSVLGHTDIEVSAPPKVTIMRSVATFGYDVYLDGVYDRTIEKLSELVDSERKFSWME
jgi:hypothetical protein